MRREQTGAVSSPANSTPVWLLDVDGVLNALHPGWDSPAQQGVAVAYGTAFRLRWAPALVDRIARLHRSGSVEVRWATTWVDEIDQVERLLRLPRFPTAFTGLGAAPSVQATGRKWAAALEVVEEERRPLLWTDDDAIPAWEDGVQRLGATGLPVMLVAPDPRTGLQPEHLAAIEAFLADPWAADGG